MRNKSDLEGDLVLEEVNKTTEQSLEEMEKRLSKLCESVNSYIQGNGSSQVLKEKSQRYLLNSGSKLKKD